MPLFLIERNLAEKLQVSSARVTEINPIQKVESVRWLISFLTFDKRKAI
jgi:hypothetical protein